MELLYSKCRVYWAILFRGTECDSILFRGHIMYSRDVQSGEAGASPVILTENTQSGRINDLACLTGCALIDVGRH